MDTKALRQKVLDLAIRGKLVPQDPNDEPASVLLERIRQEKQQMVKEGKLKAKDIKNDSVIFKGEDNLHYEKFADGTVECIENEIPFEIPDTWNWCRIQSSCIINPRNQLSDELELSFVSMSNISDGYANSYKSEKRTWKSVKNGYTHFAEGDVGIAKITPCFENRKSVVFHELINQYGAGTTELHIIRCFQDYLIPEYVLLLAKRNSFITGGVQTFAGDVGQQRVTKEYISNYLFPFPSYSEQKKIVDIVKMAFGFIDQIELSENELNEIIELMKSKILDLAIRGKLVPQNPDDEPASVLLERIRAEKEELIKQGKIKRDKNESIIFKGEDNSYYENIGETPNNWTVCSFNCISEVYTGNSINKQEKDSHYSNRMDGYNYIATKDVGFDSIVDYDNGIKIPFGMSKFKVAFKGDTLLCIEGGSAGRKICILEQDVCFVNKLCCFHPFSLNSKYLFYYLQSPLFKSIFYESASGLIGGVSINVLKHLPIIVPPLDEQIRIVEAIDNCFDIIDNMKKSLE